MIDFLKIAVYERVLIEKLRKSPLLQYKENKEWLSLDYETIKCKDTFSYKGILFCFYSDKLEIMFRPHYYYNNNIHNANDFSALFCISVLKEFIQIFQLTEDLINLKIINIEFGVNILSPIDCRDLVAFFLYHGRNEFRTDLNYLHSKKSYRVNAKGVINKYKIIKAYNKGVQYPEYCEINTFRFEIKSREFKYIKRKGIYSFKDLLDMKVYKTLANELMVEFKDIMLIEDTEILTNNLTPKQVKKLSEYKNSLFWYRLLQKRNDKNGFVRNRNNYLKLLTLSGNNLHEKLLLIFEEKLQVLLNDKDHKTESLVCENKGIFHTNIVGNRPYFVLKNCLVTGVDISMQKGKSFLLSHTGLKYYYFNDKKLFDEIKNKYLPKKWYDSDIHVQIMKLAHNIRNLKNNNKIRESKIIKKGQLSFYDIFV